MRATVVSMTWVLVWLLLVGTVNAQLWSPYVEFGGQGSQQSLGQGNLFLPLSQDDTRLTFVDMRGMWSQVGAAEGNWGLANRLMLREDLILGGYGFYDLRATENNSQFRQVTVGLELLSQNWGLRGNGYIPLNATGNASATADIIGDKIMMFTDIETAYHGFDLEAERLLWNHSPRTRPGGSLWESLDAQLWASAGGFFFDTEMDLDNTQQIAGPRLRTELRLFDLALLGPGSRLTMGADFRYDDVRGGVASGLISVRIPFGAGASDQGRGPQGINRRMVAPIVRDVDVVAINGKAIEEALIWDSNHPRTAFSLDGDTANVSQAIQNTGQNSIIFAYGDRGVIHVNNQIALLPGQTIIGGGAKVPLVGSQTGTSFIWTVHGARPTFDMGLNDFVMNSQTQLIGLDIQSSTPNATPIFVFERVNILVDQVNLLCTGDGTYGVYIAGTPNAITISNSTITMQGDNSHAIHNVASASTLPYVGIPTVTLENVGIQMQGSSSIGVYHYGAGTMSMSNSTIAALESSSIGAQINGTPSATFENSTITAYNEAIQATNATIDISGGTFQSNQSDAILLQESGTYRIASANVQAQDSAILAVMANSTIGQQNTMNLTLSENTLNSATHNGLTANLETSAAGAANAVNLSVSNNVFNSGQGGVHLTDTGSNNAFNITQGPLGSSLGLDLLNGIPSGNVTFPGSDTTFNRPVPATP